MNVDFFVAAVLCGIPAFLAARVVRRFHWDTEARNRSRANLGLALDRLPSVAPFYRDPGTDTAGNNSQTGRRAILRTHGGHRVGAHAAQQTSPARDTAQNGKP